ncbi:hypothetical protein K7432_009668 [Basidiobolus ranarum]|uniref:C2H2-type domain-containing protein n=1 Tax=Basidiobolus ranarum TaxID=34480 RepID=A0ABR2WPU9_9FUNG
MLALAPDSFQAEHHAIRSSDKTNYHDIIPPFDLHHLNRYPTLSYDCQSTLSAPSSPPSSVSSRSPEDTSVSPPKVSNIYKLLNFDHTESLPSLNSSKLSNTLTPEADPSSDRYSVSKIAHDATVSNAMLRTITSKVEQFIPASIETWHTRSLANMTAVHRVHPYRPSQSYLCKNPEPSTGFVNDKSHRCQFPGCQMRFKRLEHLKRHFRVHTLERPYSCEVEGCEKTFSRRDNLGQHMKTHDRRNGKPKADIEISE